MSEWNNKEMGGLWINEAKSGKKYMSGVIKFNDEEVRVLIFKNEHKKAGEKSPDYRVYVDDKQPSAPVEAAPKQEAKPKAKSKPKVEVVDTTSDDIPF